MLKMKKKIGRVVENEENPSIKNRFKVKKIKEILRPS